MSGVCRFFQKGKCNKGDWCPFIHFTPKISDKPKIDLLPGNQFNATQIRNQTFDIKASTSPISATLQNTSQKDRYGSISNLSQVSDNDEEIFSDSDSETSNSSFCEKSTDDEPKEKNFLLLIEPSNPNSINRLNDYIEKEKKDIIQIFNSDFRAISSKIQHREEKSRNRQFERSDDTINNQQSLILKNMTSFKTEMERLSKNQIVNKYLFSAYSREFRRARAKLPFYAFRHFILEKLAKNDILIIIGHTGSGKTTQVPQYLLEAGYARNKKIVCTQPRKIAAMTVCKRIANELDCENTNLVDYKTNKSYMTKAELEKREKKNPKDNKLILMTDKLLLNEYKRDNMLRKYSCIIIDEAHERTLFTDILLCELKKLVQKRKEMNIPLKLIIMSATIDESKISTYFNSSEVVRVPGQVYPVKVYYEKLDSDYVSQAIQKIYYLVKNDKIEGHVLVFLPSHEDIRKALLKLKISNHKFVLLSLHGNMNMEEQAKVFEEIDGKIKIIFTTNVAETSITVNGVRVIIDSGRVKERVYDQERNISILKLKLINQSSAQQRKGRAGRMQPGECYRLYEQDDYEKMEFCSEPEVLRMHLGVVVLELLSFGVKNILDYDLIDKPERTSMLSSIKKLEGLGFVENGKITDKGKIAADLYLEPMISRMIIEGLELGVGPELVKIAAMMTISNILYKKELDKDEKNSLKVQNSNENGDLFTQLLIYQQFERIKYKEQRNWCQENNFSHHALKLAKQAYGELFGTIKRKVKKNAELDEETKNSLIMKSICAGLNSQLAFFNGKINQVNVYKLYELNQEAFIHIDSVFSVLGDSDFSNMYFLYTDLMRTDRLYMRNLTRVSLELLRNYSNIDFKTLKKELKTKICIEDLNTKIIEKLKENNNEMVEQIEQCIGSTLIIGKNSIEAYVLEKMSSKNKQEILNIINMAKDRLKNEMFVYRPADLENSTRIIIKAGLNIHTILIKNEYIRLNFVTSKQFGKEKLEQLFRDKVIELRFNKVYSNKLTGYVICNDFKTALQLFEHNGSVENNSILSLQPSFDINDNENKFETRHKTIRANWFFNEPTGTAFLSFKQGANLAFIRDILVGLNYFRPEIVDNNQIKISNINRSDKYLDDIDLKNQLKNYIPDLESCSLVRKNYENVGSIENFDLQMQTLLIQSLFSQYGDIDDLRIMPFHISKKGEIKPKISVIVKYKESQSAIEAIKQLDRKIIPNDIVGWGRIHLETNFIYEYKIPTKAAKTIGLNDLISSLKERCNVDYKENYDQKDNDLLIVKTTDQISLNNLVDYLDKLIKPVSINLPYFKYDKIRKNLNNQNRQDKIQKEYGVFIHKNQKFNQINIYGRKDICENILRDLLKEVEDTESKSIEIQIRSMKAIVGFNSKTYNELCDKFRGEIKLDYKAKKVIFISKESQINEFKQYIEEIQNKYLNIKTSSSDLVCDICQCKIESPFQLTSCNHTFCKDCLKVQINFSANCIRCESEFFISDIKDILGQKLSDIEEVCSKKLNTFLTVNPIFKYCSECNQIFAKQNSNQDYCQPCDQRVTLQRRKNENLLTEKFIQDSLKKCPGCGVPIEKNDGCNHMTCVMCKIHFCWKCFFIGNNSDIIYQHLRENHQGVFDIPENIR